VKHLPAKRWAWIALAGLWLAACAPAGPTAPPLPEEEARHTVYVVSNGWHGALVLERALVAGRIPEAADVEGPWLELGWGDREYYPSPDPGIGAALSAVMVPTPAVMHLAGLEGPPQSVYPALETVAVPVGETGLDRLVEGLDAAFDRGGAERAAPSGPGLYGASFFYPAHGSFHLFHTCNTWIAERLAAARPELSADGIVTADALMARVRELAGAEVVAP